MLEPPGRSHSWAPLFESLPTGVMLADAEGRYLEANAAASRILGYDRETLLASRLPEPRSQLLAADGSPLSPDDTPGALALRTGKAAPRQVLGVVGEDGDVLWLGLSAEPLPEGGVLVSFEDVTRQHLTENILAARARLSELAPSVSLEALLRATLDEAERLTGSCIGFFHFMEADQQTLTLQAWSTRTEDEFCMAVGKGLHYAVSQAGVWVDAVHARKPVIHNDYASLPHKRGMPEGHAQVLRELVVPVLRGERIMALLGVGNKPFPYGKRDLQTVQSLADLAWDIAERKRAEEALERSQAQFRRISENAKDLIYIYRLEPTPGFEWVSPSCLAMTGYTPEEHYADPMLGKRILHPDDAPKIPVLLAELKDPPETLRLRWVKKDGTVVWIEQVCSYIRDGAGKVVAVQGIARDVTSEVENQRALEESEARWITMVEQAGDGFELLDEEGRYLQVNQATCRDLGYSREELLGKTIIEVDPNLTLESFRAQFQSLIDHPAVTFETVHQRKDGTEFPVEVTVSVTQLGGQHRALTNVRDITDRKRTEKLLRATRDQLSLVLDSLDAHVAVLDGAGNIVTVNEPWRNFARENGITNPVGTVEQVNYLEVLACATLDSSGDIAAVRDGVEGVLKGTRATFTTEYPCNSPTELRWFRMHVMPLRSGQVGAVITHENITEEKLAKVAVEQAHEQLAFAQRAAQAGTWEWNLKDSTFTWSREMFELYGLDPDKDQADLETYRKVVHPDDWPVIEANMQRAVAEQSPFADNYRTILPDGQVRWIHAQGSFDRNAQGQASRVAGICVDHTRQKTAELALAASESQARAMLRTAQDGVWLADMQARFLEVNEAACRMLGYSAQELRGMCVSEIEADEDPQEVVRHAERIAMRGFDLFESRLRRKDGSTFPVEVSVTHLPDLDRLVVFVRDITKRKQAERSLEASQRFLAETERIGHVGGWEFDIDTQEQTWTEEVYRIHDLDSNFKPTLDRGLSFYDATSRPVIEDAVRRAMEHGKAFDLELGIITAKGNPRHVHVIGKVDLDRRKIFGFIQDISERKAIEAALLKSQVQIREALLFNEQLLASMPIGAAAYRGESGRCIMANEAIALAVGGTREGLLHQDFRDIESWKTSGILEVAERVIATGSEEQVEFHLHSTFGRECWLSCTFSTFSSAEGNNLLVLCADTTERKRAELALLQSERQYRSLFDTMNEGFALHEIISGEEGKPFDYRFLDVNPAFVAMTGLPRHQWVGRTVREILPGIEPRWIREYGQVVQTGIPVTFEEESRDLGRWYRVTAYRPAPRQFAALVTDITDTKRIEEERRLLEQQIARTQKMESLGSLAGGVAHDMNNVLGAIMGLASIHQEQAAEDSHLHKSMATILKACTRGRTLVKGLLGFARQGLEEVRVLDLNDVIREEVALLERTIPPSVRIETDLHPSLRRIHGDPAALSHVLMNVCVNALDAMPEGGSLSIRTRNEEGDRVSLEVVDTGCGMAQDVLEKALDPFFTTKGQGKGTGLGLSIVYGAMKAHHGQMELASTPGAGTRVVMRFPATTAEPGPDPSASRRFPEGHPMKVLVVDDDELIQHSLVELLQSMGHRPTLAATGEKALHLLAQGLAVNVVFLDLNMPGLGGVGTLPRLRAAYPELPVLITTGRADQQAMDLVARTSKTMLLPKPFSSEEIASHFRQLGLC